jgi:predicted O-methyltransferase YrrM
MEASEINHQHLPPLTDWIAALFACPKLLRMGHAQRQDDLNLGLGWLYYALARTIRPATAVVIGSYRGFVPLVLARALADNREGGQLHFIDPSFVDDFLKEETVVGEYFARFGITNIRHYLMTTQQFVQSASYQQLGEVGIVFIDGYHTAEQARFDFAAFAHLVTPSGMLLLHDSVWQLPSWIYGPEYLRTVSDFVAELKRENEWQVLDIPFGDGVTLVRRAAVPPAPSPVAETILAVGRGDSQRTGPIHERTAP